MNQKKIASWIEQAEARSICELATAEPNLFKMALTPPLRSPAGDGKGWVSRPAEAFSAGGAYASSGLARARSEALEAGTLSACRVLPVPVDRSRPVLPWMQMDFCSDTRQCGWPRIVLSGADEVRA